MDYEDWKNHLESEYPDMSETERIELMYELNGYYPEDERINLNIQLSNPILVYADLGLWNRRVMGFQMIDSGNLRDCLYNNCEYIEWFVDRLGDFRCKGIHHDGQNNYLYRAIKENATESRVRRLQGKIYDGTATRADITRVTRRLGDDIAHVYGFSIPGMRQKQAAAR